MSDRAPVARAARSVFVARTSTTESWKAHASSATSWSGRLGPVDVAPVDGQVERRGDLPPSGGLQAAEREVERLSEPGAREAPVMERRSGGRGHDRGTARVRQAEQPPDLVERLARRVVDRLPEQPVAQVVAHLDEERVAAADDEGDERELGCRRLGLVGVEQPRRVDVTLQVVDRHERQVERPGERLGHRDADEQRAREPGALGHRDRRDVRPVRQARSLARLVEDRDHPAQVRAGRDLRHDPAGRRMERDLARDDARR